MEISQDEIRRNLEQVQERIRRAADKAHRDSSEIRLVVVTKSHSMQVARAAIEAGAKILGENYAEEGLSKIQEIGSIPGVEWHMIGHVQSRKAVEVTGKFNLIHSLDSVKLAERINRVAEANWVVTKCSDPGQCERGRNQIRSSVLERWSDACINLGN